MLAIHSVDRQRYSVADDAKQFRAPARTRMLNTVVAGTTMPFEKTDGMIRHTRLPNESREYLERREELRRAELELIRQSERVAALRRSLPQGRRRRTLGHHDAVLQRAWRSHR